MNETQRDRLLTRYLLGDLPEDEADRLELRLLDEPDLFETAEAIEGELVDAYALGELDTADREAFERLLLRSERIRDRVATAQALARVPRAADATAPRPAVVAADPKPGLWERLFPAPARLAWAATLVTAVAAGLFAVQNFELQEELQQLDRTAAVEPTDRAVPDEVRRGPAVDPSADGLDPAERTRLERTLSEMNERNQALEAELTEAREQLAAAAPPPELGPGGERRVRGPQGGDDRGPRRSPGPVQTQYLGQANRSASSGGTLTRLEIEQDRGTVELQLELGEEPDEQLMARVTREGVHVYQGRDVRIEGEGRATIALLSLPAGVFSSGLHQIELTDPEGDDPRYYEVDVVMSP